MNSATHDQRATKKSNAVKLPINVRPANYARWEGETLADAMAAAVSYPAHSWRIWAVMAARIREMNVDFRSQGEQELELIPFGTFRDLVQFALKVKGARNVSG